MNCAKPRPKFCSKNWPAASLDALMLALPLPDTEIETIRLFDDPFLLAVPASDPLPKRGASIRVKSIGGA